MAGKEIHVLWWHMDQKRGRTWGHPKTLWPTACDNEGQRGLTTEQDREQTSSPRPSSGSQHPGTQISAGLLGDGGRGR